MFNDRPDFGGSVATDALFERIKRVACFWHEQDGYLLATREGQEWRDCGLGRVRKCTH